MDVVATGSGWFDVEVSKVTLPLLMKVGKLQNLADRYVSFPSDAPQLLDEQKALNSTSNEREICGITEIEMRSNGSKSSTLLLHYADLNRFRQFTYIS